MRLPVKISIGVVLLLMCDAGLTQEGHNQPTGDVQSNVPAKECQPKRTVLQDGTILVQERDCSIRGASKQEVEAPPEPASATTQQVPQTGVGTAKFQEIKPQALPPGIDDPQLTAKYTQAMTGYFDYYAAGYVHRQRVFEWQLFSSKIIFLLVTLLVSSGIYFAALQFHQGLRQRVRQAAPSGASAGDAGGEPLLPQIEDSPVTTFSASATGIEVSSPVLGVVILVISLAFFYLYLVYVYPITELF